MFPLNNIEYICSLTSFESCSRLESEIVSTEAETLIFIKTLITNHPGIQRPKLSNGYFRYGETTFFFICHFHIEFFLAPCLSWKGKKNTTTTSVMHWNGSNVCIHDYGWDWISCWFSISFKHNMYVELIPFSDAFSFLFVDLFILIFQCCDVFDYSILWLELFIVLLSIQYARPSCFPLFFQKIKWSIEQRWIPYDS